MKKIINDPNNVVGDMLKGMQISNPNIIYNS